MKKIFLNLRLCFCKKVYLDQYHRDKPDENDAITEMRIMRYLCASEVATRILELRMYMTTPAVTSIPIHLPMADTVPRKGASQLEIYFNRPTSFIFDDVPLSGKDAPNGDYIPGLWEVYIVNTVRPGQAFIDSRKKVDFWGSSFNDGTTQTARDLPYGQPVRTH